MKIITSDKFQTALWKNGGGVTHQIKQNQSENTYSWRFSLAEVGENGPFSRFPERARVLTVVKGQGMTLISPSDRLQAKPYCPVYFDGDIPVNGKLLNGPVLNYNLVFNPKLIRPEFSIIRDVSEMVVSVPPEGRICLFAATGDVAANGQTLHTHDFAISRKEDMYISVNPLSVAVLTAINVVTD